MKSSKEEIERRNQLLLSNFGNALKQMGKKTARLMNKTTGKLKKYQREVKRLLTVKDDEK